MGRHSDERLTFEIFSSESLNLERIPQAWELTITATSDDLEPTLQTYRRLGPRHTPHIAAALVESEEHARQIAGIVTDKAFLVGGDLEPRGPFERSVQLFPYFQHCREIGVAGYPEGHPSYPDEELGDEILLEKQELGAAYAVTQMCFDPQRIIDWVKRIRARGVTLPLHCGVAAPIDVVKLTRFALRCGVNTSLNAIKKMSTRDVANVIRRYDPRPLMEAVYDHVDGFHIYTFNTLKTTKRWVEEIPWLSELAASVDGR